jgi:hypothetical protein
MSPMSEEPRPQPDGRDDDLGVKHRNALYAFAGVGVLALVVLVISSVLSGGVKNTAVAKVAPLMKAAGCSFKSVTAYVPKGQGTHVDSLTKKLPWNTSPPSNGQHNPAWAVWGFYTKPVNPRLVVHNEEHGGVIIWWGTQVPAATVAELRAFYNEKTDGSFGTPYANFGSKIAITAWTGHPALYQRNGYYGEGHIAVCTRYDAATKAAFEDFRDAYIGQGPQGISLALDFPGMGPH